MPMRMEFNLGQRLELRMKLAPQILQSIEILQLPTLELLQRIKQELVENPVLEIDESQETPPESSSTSNGDATPEAHRETETTQAEPEAGATDLSFEKVEPLIEHFNDYGSPPSGSAPSAGEKDKKMEAMLNTAARAMSLQDYMYNQFNLLDVTERQREIGHEIIYNIDNDGYLRSSLEEVFPPVGSDVTSGEAAETLAVIQTLDPPGVGGRDLRECLLLQMTNGNDHPLARVLISEHLEDIEKNRYPRMCRETGYSMEAVKAAVEFITHLSPRPGNLFGEEMPQYITPDVMVEQDESGEYTVRLEDQRIPRLYISPVYTRLLQDRNSSDEERDYVRKKIQSARWLIDAIEQRRDTLMRICEDVFRVQREFLDRGVKHLRPLKMRTVADRVGVHVSTVSRAIAEKYAQTPRGIFPLKYFFTGGTQSADGIMTSRKSVKQHVLEAIEDEDKISPLSDDDIANLLQQKGLNIARRTVTKYRKAMNIPTARRRKAY